MWNAELSIQFLIVVLFLARREWPSKMPWALRANMFFGRSSLPHLLGHQSRVVGRQSERPATFGRDNQERYLTETISWERTRSADRGSEKFESMQRWAALLDKAGREYSTILRPSLMLPLLSSLHASTSGVWSVFNWRGVFSFITVIKSQRPKEKEVVHVFCWARGVEPSNTQNVDELRGGRPHSWVPY